jgi:uncharacterized SAM-binding protein YcdF (DUF218 family)
MITSRRFKIVYITLASLLVVACAGWWWRAPLLRGAARLWIVDDAPARADAIVILGGGLDSRPTEAARLYHQGLAPRILVMQPELSRVTRMGLVIDYYSLTRTLLLMDKVPAEAIVPLPQSVRSTFDEANALATWARANNAHQFLVPTDLFHTRRARWILRRILNQPEDDIRMIPTNPKDYTAADWWQQEEGLVDFQNEMVKFGMYLCRY